MTGGTIGGQLVALLEQHGADTVFGIPGVHTIELYRALAGSRLRHVTPRHEQAAGFMADGYARVSGRPGVCFLITGPGLTNSVTALAQAYADSVPMLAVSTVVPRYMLGRGRGFLHELADQRQLLRQVTAFSHTVLDARSLGEAVGRAFAVFRAARPRPVHIEIPTDLATAPAGSEQAGVAEVIPPAADPRALSRAAGWCAQATAPLLLVGGGARHAAPQVAELARRLDAPAVLTVNARGVLPPDDPRQVSISPTEPEVRALIEQADLVLAIGTELGPTDYDVYGERDVCIPGRLLRIDIDPEQAARGRMADLALIGDTAPSLDGLLAALGPQPARASGAARADTVRAAARARFGAPLQAQLRLLERVRDELPGAILVGDSTQLVYAGNIGFAAASPATWFNSATGYGTLGYGLPAALGAALAAPERPVVALLGDGGLQYSLAELGTAVEAGLAPIVLLLNNRGFGEIKTSMIQAGVVPIGVDLFTPDFAGVAAAYGWGHRHLAHAGELETALRAAQAASRPAIVELTPNVMEDA